MYGKLEWKIGNICDGGRDLDGAEPFEYWDNLSLAARESGFCKFARGLGGGEVTRGGKGGWFGLVDGELIGDVKVGEKEVSIIVGGIEVAILISMSQAR